MTVSTHGGVPMPSGPPRTPGQVAYLRFRDAIGGVRPWSELNTIEQDAWEQAAEGVIEECITRRRW